MQNFKIDPIHLSLYSSPVIHYLKSLQPLDIEIFDSLIVNRKFKTEQREILVNELLGQYKHLNRKSFAAAFENIEKLRSEDTYTITTGHQLCVFTGPLYFIYKIASTIKLCKDLETRYSHKNFVPVFWMAGEDHDFEEIKYLKIKNKTYEFTPKNYNGGACGFIKTEGISSLIEQVETDIPEIKLSELWTKMKNHYLNSGTLGESTFHIVNDLFSKYGVLVIDPSVPGLKKQFAPIVWKDITEQNSFHLVQQSIEDRNAIGQSAQIQPREINFFYLKQSFRERIVKENDRFQVLNSDISFSSSELEAEIMEYPERFSPNVVMRPLYQEVILPNIAYIGGPAEVNYWLQLIKVFDYYSIAFPAVVPRDSFYLISQSMINDFCHAGFNVDQLFEKKSSLISMYLEAKLKEERKLSDSIENLHNSFSNLLHHANEFDANLNSIVSAAEAKLKKIEDKLILKLKKVLKSRESQRLNMVDEIFDRAFPNSKPQERVCNILEYSGFFENNFIDSIVEISDPLELKIKVIGC